MMVKEELSFRIELVKPKSECESDDFARNFVHLFGLKTNSGTWSEIYLDNPLIHDFINESKNLIKRKVAQFNGYCTLNQYLEEDYQNQYEWYELETDKIMSLQDSGDFFTCRADKMSPNDHILIGRNFMFVSEKFKQVVEKYHLTGIDFIWVKDVGKYKAMQWYLAVPTYPLGRGLDHPWFNSKKLKGKNSYQPTTPMYRYGINSFSVNQIKKNVIFNNDIQKEIISLFQNDVLTIHSYKKYLKDYLPNTDFAYTWLTEDAVRDDEIIKYRGLCISRNAKKLLMDNKLVTKNNIKPIEIYDDVPNGVEILDGKGPMPTTFYSCKNIDFNILKEKVDTEWKKFNTKIKPEKIITFKQAIKFLVEEKKKRPEDFNKGITKKQALINPINNLAEPWLEILRKSNGCILNDECTLLPLSKIYEFTKEKQEESKEVYEDYPLDLISIAYAPDGDWYSLENIQGSNIDSKVLRISHEGFQQIEQWNSIGEFLFDMLTEYYD